METEMETTPERVVEKTVHFQASRERVWMAITDPAELAMWFGDEAELDLRVGGDGAMTWENHGRYEMRVEEVDAPRRLVWSWVGGGGVAFDDAQTTRVEWELTTRTREDGGTTLVPTRVRLPQRPRPWAERPRVGRGARGVGATAGSLTMRQG